MSDETKETKKWRDDAAQFDASALVRKLAAEPRQESILDWLKVQRIKIDNAQKEAMSNAFTWQSHADIEAQRLRDVDTAIAALSPAPPEAPEDDTLDLSANIAEGFTAWMGGVYGDFVRDNPSIDRVNTELEVILRHGTRCTGLPGGFSWNHGGDWDDIIAYRIIEAAPVADEQDDASEFAFDDGAQEMLEESYAPGHSDADLPALNEAMHDDREQPVYIAQGSIQDVAQPEWNVPTLPGSEPDGYAPVTDPDADAISRAHDYYDPRAVAKREAEERQKFNPFGIFGHKRETEEVS